MGAVNVMSTYPLPAWTWPGETYQPSSELVGLVVQLERILEEICDRAHDAQDGRCIDLVTNKLLELSRDMYWTEIADLRARLRDYEGFDYSGPALDV